jgi:hypothetical protein
MNVADGRSRSCWVEDAPAIEARPLQSDETCDVVVIGSGIAGLSTAYELSRFGRSLIAIDRGRIGRGMTARTLRTWRPNSMIFIPSYLRFTLSYRD